uniref:DZANK-type domain-containing protein n=1 Tax=Ciona savignyi TaxID=51511 RepID=H2YJ22_CIOSA
RCVYCSAPRPRNSTSRFCSDCGKPVPIDPTTSSVEPGSMGMCIKCRSYVPLNQTKCIVCEEPFGALPKPIVSVRMRSCVVHAGPTILPDLTHCTFHAVNTGSPPIHSGDTAPPLPRLDGQLVRCPTCTRVNNPDARYCDWCGAKVEQTPMTCSLCKSNNQPYSKFCAQCGSTFTPPNRMDPRNEDLGDQAINFPFQTLPMWTSVPVPTLPKVLRAPKPRVREVDTQTVGLFYPGGKKVNQEQEMMREMRMQEIKMRDKQPPLTAVSPGRGFWRKQLDHICGHLRSYTNNNVEFRSVIGEPRLGKILGTSIEEGEEEMIVSLKFALRGHNDVVRNWSVLFLDSLLSIFHSDLYQSKKKVAFGSTFDQEEPETEKPTKKKKKNKNKSLIREEKMNVRSSFVAIFGNDDKSELGPRGEGRWEEVAQLIKEGADPNAIDAERRSVLAIAVMRDRIDCVKALLKGGSDVNRRSGPHHNSPLHLAVKLGPDGKDIVKLLLEHDAKIDVKNERGLSPYDLAVRADYNSILALF